VFIREQDPLVRKKGPLVLIVTHTKEVAKEVLSNAQMFIQQALCSFCCLFDDENITTQVLNMSQMGKRVDLYLLEKNYLVFFTFFIS
jgi:hypothetical protein